MSSNHWAIFYRNKMTKKRNNEEEQSMFTGGFQASLYGAVNSVSYDEQDIQSLSEKMRARLKWHYMNSYQKYKAGGRKPWKLLIQIIKIFLVTAQVCINMMKFDMILLFLYSDFIIIHLSYD